MKDMEYGSTKMSQLAHVTIEQAADGIFWLDPEGRKFNLLQLDGRVKQL